MQNYDIRINILLGEEIEIDLGCSRSNDLLDDCGLNWLLLGFLGEKII
jgi:hypothetical protein